ncbi:hypothetical protein E3J62_08455 [candidate division TA06 bacterium]|uniref:Uncharacterized protein n=1 Tax=candidate division TA06 bacterium TaxID=2250710 RepID=A0A523URF8_UNCT6|nr:MAG: hypothetical protein E3J62_08455 [candidate division TA06 bacterium]
MSLIKDLRPVEALHLLIHARKELDRQFWGLPDPRRNAQTSSLVATIVYLANERYIQPRKLSSWGELSSLVLRSIALQLTEKGKEMPSSLRTYEMKCLEAIAENRARDLYHAVRDFDFREFLANEGLLRTQRRKRGVWILKWTHTDYLPTGEYEKAMQELHDLKWKIQSAIRAKSQDRYLISMSYAFPSVGSNAAFSKYAKKTAHPVDPDYIIIAAHAAKGARRVADRVYRSEHSGSGG